MKKLIYSEKLERLSQKDIIRFFTIIMDDVELNPSKYDEPIDVENVRINDEGLTMTRVEITLKNRFNGKRTLYTDYHALDYSCSNIGLSKIE